MAFLTAFVSCGRRHRSLGRLVAGLALLLASATSLPAQTSAPSREYQIKAAFLFNFAQFVDWPDTAFATADAPLAIGILGNDPFGPTLDKIVLGETVHRRRLVVVRSSRVEDLAACQVLFVSRSEAGRLREIMARLEAKPILTVSEIPGFAEQGGVIRLTLVAGKVRFEINPAAGRQRGLKLSSHLIGVGKIVGGDGRKEHD